MKKSISVMHLSHLAWKHFKKDLFSWLLLTVGHVVFMVGITAVYFYLPEYKMISMIAAIALLGGLYNAILYQNALDSAYNRKLSLLKVSPKILFASLFFIAISLYNPFPEYGEWLLYFLPEDFQFFILVNWIIHALVTYALVRCMFIGLILLEEKTTAVKAFHKSLALTNHHVFFLIFIYVYLALIGGLCAATIIGYFIALPYTLLVKAFLFKELHHSAK